MPLETKDPVGESLAHIHLIKVDQVFAHVRLSQAREQRRATGHEAACLRPGWPRLRSRLRMRTRDSSHWGAVLRVNPLPPRRRRRVVRGKGRVSRCGYDRGRRKAQRKKETAAVRQFNHRRRRGICLLEVYYKVVLRSAIMSANAGREHGRKGAHCEGCMICLPMLHVDHRVTEAVHSPQPLFSGSASRGRGGKPNVMLNARLQLTQIGRTSARPYHSERRQGERN